LFSLFILHRHIQPFLLLLLRLLFLLSLSLGRVHLLFQFLLIRFQKQFFDVLYLLELGLLHLVSLQIGIPGGGPRFAFLLVQLLNDLVILGVEEIQPILFA
jgi:hypothetical protein